MVRRTHHGRPGTEVLPRDWSARHRPTAAATMTSAECEIRRPATKGALDRDTLTRPSTVGELIYAGPCRVVRVNRELRQPVAEQQLTVLDFLVALPFTNELDAKIIEPGMRVTFTETDDPYLLRLAMTVTAELPGSHVWERDLYCLADTTPRAA